MCVLAVLVSLVVWIQNQNKIKIYAFAIPWSIVGVTSSRALPGFPYYCAALVCVPAVIGALTVWRQKKKFEFIYLTLCVCIDL